MNEERLARRRAAQFGEQAELCRSAPCAACGRKPPSDPHHVRSRAAGGTDRDTVPLCPMHHAEIHSRGRETCEREWGVDLVAVADRMHAHITGAFL